MKHRVATATVLDYRTEAAARKALGGNGQLPYRGVWFQPSPEAPLVHVFTWLTAVQVEQAGWRRPAWVTPPTEPTDRRTA